MKKLLAALLILLLASCGEEQDKPAIVALRFLDSGRIILAIDDHYRLVKFDWDSREASVLFEHVNPYSLYSIKGSDRFLYQKLEQETIYLADLAGHNRKFVDIPFQVNSHAVSTDLSEYFVSDIKFNLYQVHYDRMRVIKPADNGFDYDSTGKSLGLQISNDGKYLLSAAFSHLDGTTSLFKDIQTELLTDDTKGMKLSPWTGVMVWEVKSGKPLYKFIGDKAKTTASFSQDSRYVISGDENDQAFVWRLDKGELLHQLSDEGLPNDFCSYRQYTSNCDHHTRVNALLYIDDTHFLRFSEGVDNYALLYEQGNASPSAALPLAHAPNTFGYELSMRADSSPKRHYVALSEDDRLLLYDFYKGKLNLIWSPQLPPVESNRWL